MTSYFPMALNNIPNMYQTAERNKGFKTITRKPYKTTFKAMAISPFEPDSGSSSSNGEKHLTSSNYTIGGLFTTLTSSISLLKSEMLKMFNPPLHPSVDPNYVLTGNFAPVDETPPTECFVLEGKIPPSLNGAYIRNGPNPQHYPCGPYHLFSGDGMLHSIKLTKGRAIFCSRYVKTLKYKLEHEEGSLIIPNVLSGFYGINHLFKFVISLSNLIAKRLNLVESFGLANTSLAFFHGSFFALMDSDLPYKIRLTLDGDIETLERYGFTGKAPLNMNAHPKFDEETKELFGFELHPIYPHLILFRFDGSNRENVPIYSAKGFSYVHDLALTKNYVIFLDNQLEISLTTLFLCKGMPLSHDPTKVSRIGIIPRYASSDSDLRWFQLPRFNAFHILNVWEENKDQVVIITPTISSPHDFLYNVDNLHMYLEKIVIDLKTCSISRVVLSKQVVEMGSINPPYYGKKNRYAFMAINESSTKMCGVVKIDLELECEVAIKLYGPGCFGGEACFIPASNENDFHSSEDDGFVVSFVHNENTNESYFVVLDAETLELVSKVRLPSRVPYGFHGLFVTKEQLDNL